MSSNGNARYDNVNWECADSTQVGWPFRTSRRVVCLKFKFMLKAGSTAARAVRAWHAKPCMARAPRSAMRPRGLVTVISNTPLRWY
eukprot:SAG31_NODE_12845_length_910_cov_1.437884_1_plen_85_part_01